MTQRASESLVAALIRVGLLLALAIMLMAENAQAQPPSTHFTDWPFHQLAATDTRCRHPNQPDGVAGTSLPGRQVGARRIMKFEKQLSSLMTAALLCGTFTTLSSGQQTTTPASGVVAGTPTALPAVSASAAADAALVKSTPPLTEDDLRARYVGKLIFLRGSYLGDDLQFDMDGKVNGSPAIGSFTLSAFEVRKVKLSKHKLDIEADRYGLHFLGALPYEDDDQGL